MKKSTIILLFIFSSISFAAGGKRNLPSSTLFEQGFLVRSYHALGFSNIAHSTIYNLAEGNPAALTEYRNLTIGTRTNISTKIDMYGYYDIDKAKPYIPASLSILVPFKNFNLGVSYNQKYSLGMEFGSFPITTVENPYGNESNTEPEINAFIHSFSGLANYSFKDFFSDGLNFTIGAQFEYNYYYENIENSHFDNTLSGDAIAIKIGALADVSKNIKIGFVFDTGSDIRAENKPTNILSDNNSSGDNQSYQIVNLVSPKKIAPRLAFGISLNSSPKLTHGATISLELWNKSDDGLTMLKEISYGIIYKLNKTFGFSAGAFYANGKNVENSIVDNEVFYLSMGLRSQLNNFDVNLQFSDSHIISETDRQHLLVELGVGYSFN